ncbi:glutamate racemase [Desulfallas sp. Bu1-1]|jgi:glutamate racemase|nr:glutamate racemase [Desulfallas sp. Bu1-1]
MNRGERLVPNPNPIGIFDSGVGGISVMREIRRLLPAEDLLYFADSAHCPYGIKTPEEICSRIFKIAQFMVNQNAKLIVSACNTASIAGLELLRRAFELPIVGMEPAIKPAAAITRNGKVGVMATGVTISGQKFLSLLSRFANGVEVIKVACPGLVEQVEQGFLDDPETEELLKTYLAPLIAEGVDTVVLGCTHYPFLRRQVESIMGPSVKVIDTGYAVAKRVAQVLREEGLQNSSTGEGKVIFFTSGNPGKVSQVITKLWNQTPVEINNVSI